VLAFVLVLVLLLVAVLVFVFVLVEPETLPERLPLPEVAPLPERLPLPDVAVLGVAVVVGVLVVVCAMDTLAKKPASRMLKTLLIDFLLGLVGGRRGHEPYVYPTRADAMSDTLGTPWALIPTVRVAHLATPRQVDTLGTLSHLWRLP